MKVKFNIDSGANIHSNNESEWFDPVDELGLKEGEWEKLTDDEKWDSAREWASNYLEIGFEEKED